MTSYTLTDQLHMLATVAGGAEVVVTLQHWSRGESRAVYVVCHNGVEVHRKFTNDDRDITSLRAHFARTREQHADDLLSEEAAADQVGSRGGPTPRHCVKADCPATIPVPYAAAQCAAGCDIEGRGRVEFLSVTTGKPAMTLVTGGKK